MDSCSGLPDSLFQISPRQRIPAMLVKTCQDVAAEGEVQGASHSSLKISDHSEGRKNVFQEEV